MAFQIISHTDLDGWASAAIIKAKKPKAGIHLIDYGDPFPIDKIGRDDGVAILDFCPDDPDLIQEIIEMVPVFTWIDHHVSSRKMVEENHFLDIIEPPGAFVTDSDEVKLAACELTYMQFHRVEYKDVPYHIRLLGRYDVWDHTDPQVLPFQYAMRAWIDSPLENMQKWKKLLNPSKQDFDLFKRLIEAGTYIKMYEEKKNAKLAEQLCFEMEFEGYKTLAVNRLMESSYFFKEVYHPKKHDLMLQFGWTGDKWQLSFRSDKKDVDCSVLAERFGGGGHAMSSGTVVQELPQEIKKAIGV